MVLYINRQPEGVRLTVSRTAAGVSVLLITTAALWWLAAGLALTRIRAAGPSAAVHRSLRYSVVPVLLAATVTAGSTVGCTSEPDATPTPTDPTTRAAAPPPTPTPEPTAVSTVVPSPIATLLPTPTPNPTLPNRGCGRLCDEDFWATAGVSDVQAELDAGADIVGRSLEHNSATPLHLAILNDADVEVVALLLDRGAKLSAGYNEGMTPLHSAVANQAGSDIIVLLLDRGANANARAVNRLTPFGLALANDASLDIVRILLDSGAELLPDDVYYQPLYQAAGGHSDPAVLELILSRLSDGEADSYNHEVYVTKALSRAARVNPHPGVVEWLLNQSQGGMCICRVLGIGAGVSRECFGP